MLKDFIIFSDQFLKQTRVQVKMTNDAVGSKAKIQTQVQTITSTQSKPAPKKTITLNRTARYRARDAHAALLQPKLKPQNKQKRKSRKKPKRAYLTDKQQAVWAR